MENQEKLLSAEVIGHQDESSRLVMIRVTAAEVESEERPPVRLAIVLDRSGSMSGERIDVARRAAAKLIRSLNPDDRVSAVIFDHHVEQLAPLSPPSEGLAKLVERVQAGGSTNLHGGWLAGAKAVTGGGHVILLSDGHANHGRYSDAMSLSQQARKSYADYKVTTTTIGVGDGYDEGVMAGMARHGGGSHYFASDVDSVMKAFAQERMNIGEIVVERVKLMVGGETRPLGHLWSGESKSIVIPIECTDPVPILITYSAAGSDEEQVIMPAFPKEFQKNDEVTLEYLIALAAEVEDEVVNVHSSEHAGAVRQRARDMQLALLNHALSETPIAQAVIDRMGEIVASLEVLERRYDENLAVYERKRGAQFAHNLRNSTRSFVVEERDRAFIDRMSTRHAGALKTLTPDATALQFAPLEQWKKWSALPIDCKNVIVVALEDPKDGFLVDEIAKAVGRRVRAHRLPVPLEVIRSGLDQLGRA
jgi:hypothetical protein